MAYDNTIPKSTDLISNSQAQLLENFSQLDKQFGSSATVSGGVGDHIAFSSASNNGYHQQVRFPNAPSEPTATGTISAIFPLLNATTGQQELYFKNSSTEYAGSGKTQLTGPVTASASGSAYLPGGIIIKWGTATITGAQSVSFSSAFPTACWSVVCQTVDASGPTSANTFIYLNSIGTSSFAAVAVRRTSLASATAGLYYIAIGN